MIGNPTLNSAACHTKTMRRRGAVLSRSGPATKAYFRRIARESSRSASDYSTSSRAALPRESTTPIKAAASSVTSRDFPWD